MDNEACRYVVIPKTPADHPSVDTALPEYYLESTGTATAEHSVWQCCAESMGSHTSRERNICCSAPEDGLAIERLWWGC